MIARSHPRAPEESGSRPTRRLPEPPDPRRHHRGHHAGGGPPSVRTTEVQVHHNLMAANDVHAQGIRSLLHEHHVFAINLMSSPGAGKTALIEATLHHLVHELRVAVIEGDIETTADVDRLAPFGIPAVQINTGPFGGDCHLAAPLVATAVAQLDLHALDLLIVENVGNLVCPAEFDIGEDRKVVLLSVTEGEDKPLKYPFMFRVASLAVVTKVDLLPHVDIDVDVIRANMRAVNPALRVLLLSARTGEGLEAWLAWLRAGVANAGGMKPPAQPQATAARPSEGVCRRDAPRPRSLPRP